MRFFTDTFKALEELGVTYSDEEKVYIDALAQIGGQLMAYRKKHNLTQAELAKRTGISENTIRAIESGARNVTLRTLAKIVAKLKGNLKIDLDLS